MKYWLNWNASQNWHLQNKKNTDINKSVKNKFKNHTIWEITAKSTLKDVQKLLKKVIWKMFKWKNKSFSIFLMSQHKFQHQLPRAISQY